LAGNQTERAHRLLLGLRLPVDWVGTSSSWGVEKPGAAFFERVVAACECAPSQIAYVGDRTDNDIRPAAAAGMRTVLVRRGPWGTWTSERGAAGSADLHIESLGDLCDGLSLS
jgi:FMN phosphatase YigB (HAD superfamily)